MHALDLTDHFLIAMPSLQDPNFSKTVTYICAHNEEGAMGIVINRPLDLSLGEVLNQMDLEPGDEDISGQTVYHGGPVHTDRGFILHRPGNAWSSTLPVTSNVAVSTSRDILGAISNGTGPQDVLVALGYAGWGSGQLENEMSNNAWLSGPADLNIVFSTAPGDRWRTAALLLGVDVESISHDVGHA